MPASVNRRRDCSTARAGFTLMEMMLTLAVMVMIAGLSWPVFSRSFDNLRLKKAGDALRTAWASARLQAMTTGETHVFRFEYGAGNYVVAVWNTGESATEAAAATPLERPGMLPEGTVFHASEKIVDARAAMTEGTGGQETPQLYFYPDGTTSTAQVLIANEHERFLKVELRGLTGVSKMGDVISSEELTQ
jgi:prepilin-type N-terminal cleavage/methylation domain-containing protein